MFLKRCPAESTPEFSGWFCLSKSVLTLETSDQTGEYAMSLQSLHIMKKITQAALYYILVRLLSI